MAILQPSVLPYAVPTNYNLAFIYVSSHASILHVILPLIKRFNSIIFSLSYHNHAICIQQLLW